MTSIMCAEMINEREDLIALRDQLLETLSSRLGPEDRKLLSTIRALYSAIERTSPPQAPSEYAKHKRASDAILDYLEQIGKPVPRLAIVDALEAGGFRRGQKNARWVIGQAINSFISGTGKVTGLMKEINGLVGKGDWPEDMFN